MGQGYCAGWWPSWLEESPRKAFSCIPWYFSQACGGLGRKRHGKSTFVTGGGMHMTRATLTLARRLGQPPQGFGRYWGQPAGGSCWLWSSSPQPRTHWLQGLWLWCSPPKCSRPEGPGCSGSLRSSGPWWFPSSFPPSKTHRPQGLWCSPPGFSPPEVFLPYYRPPGN